MFKMLWWLSGLLIAPLLWADVAVDPMKPQWFPGGGDGEATVTSTSQSQSPAPVLTLQSISIVGDQRSAVVNQQRVTINEKIAGAVITGIEPGEISYRFRGTTYTLSLYRHKAIVVPAENHPGDERE